MMYCREDCGLKCSVFLLLKGGLLTQLGGATLRLHVLSSPQAVDTVKVEPSLSSGKVVLMHPTEWGRNY